MAYYQRIRDLREDSDKNQTEIADYLGTTAQYYGRYERGLAEIPFERAIALAEYYNVSLDYIAGFTNNKRGIASSDLKDSQQELIRILSEISKEDKAKLAELLGAVLNAIE
ncbi:MAG: helix-turn-helix domain-containing protein [Oscillospiraceae bacterium]|nr:helix-turn-helix domain-containing protein [Oscillospiraceae bacterium]